MKSIAAAVAVLGIAAMAASPALAKPYPAGGVTASEMAAVLKARGLPAKISTDGAGDPMVESKTDGVSWRIYFYTCKVDRCLNIQFSSGFDMDDGITYEQANQWNYTKRFSRAALDDEMDPYVRYDVDAERGFTTEAADLAVETWLLVLPEFVDFIGFEPAD